MGKVPALVDGDIVVTESAAICAYLADKFIDKGLAPPLDSLERGKYYRYLFFPGTTLEPLLSTHVQGFEATDPQSVGWGDLERGKAAIESMTPDSDWVLGERFSAADVVFGGTLDFSTQFQWMEPSAKVAALCPAPARTPGLPVHSRRLDGLAPRSRFLHPTRTDEHAGQTGAPVQLRAALEHLLRS